MVVVEDEPTVGRYLRHVIVDAGYRVVALVGTAREAVDALREHRPDILLLDIHLERDWSGLELAESGDVPSETAVVFISGHADEATFQRVQVIGPAGFLVKPASERQIVATLGVALGPRRPMPDAQQELQLARDVLSGIARELERAGLLIEGGLARQRRIRELPELRRLSPREWEVLRALAAHMRPPAIAEHLSISHHTVRNHLKSIFGKLGVHSQAELLERVLTPVEPR